MSTLHYPSEKDYLLPKKNILVLSCIDLRLTDNLVDFLHFDNLHNRYDHFILAGTSLLTTTKYEEYFKKGILKQYKHWDNTLHDHIGLAIDLHGIQDMYIVEHQDCGAYTNFLNEKVDLSTITKEIHYHSMFSKELADKIFKRYKLNVHCFFIDLRGNVKLLYTKTK